LGSGTILMTETRLTAASLAKIESVSVFMYVHYETTNSFL